MAKSFGLKDPIATANAAGITTALVFVACRILVGVTPSFMFSIAQSWFHGIELTKLSSWNLSTPTFMLGLFSSGIFAWAIGYIFAIVYNFFVRR